MVEEKISLWKNSINLEKNLKVELSQLTLEKFMIDFQQILSLEQEV